MLFEKGKSDIPLCIKYTSEQHILIKSVSIGLKFRPVKTSYSLRHLVAAEKQSSFPKLTNLC